MSSTQGRYRSRFFVRVWHKTMDASSGNHPFFTISCHCQTKDSYREAPPWPDIPKLLREPTKIGPIFRKGTSMYYVSRFWGFFDPPPPLSSKVSICHDPPLVLRKLFPISAVGRVFVQI